MSNNGISRQGVNLKEPIVLLLDCRPLSTCNLIADGHYPIMPDVGIVLTGEGRRRQSSGSAECKQDHQFLSGVVASFLF